MCRWAETARALAAEYRTIRMDQRGHGQSTHHPADLSREAFADDVAAVVGAAEDIWDHLTIPVDLVLGEHGTTDSDRVDRMCALRPGTGHHILAAAGHDLHLDHSGQWIALVRKLLAKVNPVQL